VSARAARLLRQRVAATEELALRIDRDELVRLVGPPPEAHEPDPPGYARGLLIHEGLRCVPPLATAKGPVELRLEPDHALAGALFVLVPAVIAGVAGLWLYGLLMALTAAAVLFALRRRWPLLARRAPRVVPRGRLFGLLVAALAVAIVAVAVVWPVREARRPDNLGAVVVVVR
jgi:hypothetical protein